MCGAIAARISFEVFWGVVATIGLLLIAESISKYSLYRGRVMLFYCVTCLLMDIVHIRNFLGMSIVIFAFQYIHEQKIRYIILVVLASTISAMTIIFMPALFFSDKKIEYKAYVKGFILMLLLVIIGENVITQFVSKYYSVVRRYVG